MTGAAVRIPLPPKLVPVFARPRGGWRYRGAYGGRGSGKSLNFAQMAAVYGYAESLRILCTRQYQVSIKDSFHAELKRAISSLPWLAPHYDVGTDYIKGIGPYNKGTEFLFKGLERNINGIKSLAGIDLTVVEEAEDVPENAWLALEATVFRNKKSELWPIWNPRVDGSPVDQRFRKDPPKNGIIVELNHSDNPFFPDAMEELRVREEGRLDPNTYDHIWEGGYLTNSVAQILNGKVKIDDFKVQSHWDGPYYGGDFGFSQDPTAAVKCWVSGDLLFIEYEAGKVGLEIDDTAEFVCAKIPGFDEEVSRWDSARPESISYLRRNGLPRATATAKWQGSVEDGIAFLRGFKKIVVHPRCSGFIKESRFYSYKVDRLTGDVTSNIVDAWNHYIDATRYALSPLIKKGYNYRLLEVVD
jgi:phage terminase large subunit